MTERFKMVALIEHADVEMVRDCFLSLCLQFKMEGSMGQCASPILCNPIHEDGKFVRREATQCGGEIIRRAAEMWGSISALNGKRVWVLYDEEPHLGSSCHIAGFRQFDFDGGKEIVFRDVFREYGVELSQ